MKWWRRKWQPIPVFLAGESHGQRNLGDYSSCGHKSWIQLSNQRERDGTWCHDLRFWMLSFKPAFSLSSCTCIKRLFSSSLLSAIRVVSSAYLRLLIFLLAILILASASPSMAFCMMYSSCKLNKQGDDIQPWHSPFLIWNQSIVPCLILTVVSWPAYWFLRKQVRCSGIPIYWKIFTVST